MPKVELSSAEKKLLVEMLESQISELREEIHHTDDHDYRQSLKEKEKELQLLLQKAQNAA